MNTTAEIDQPGPKQFEAGAGRLRRELDRIADAVALEIRPMESVVECVGRLVRERR